MKSDVVTIDNKGHGIEEAKAETKKFAEFRKLSEIETLHLQLCAEEMLCLARSITGEMEASFWIENQDKKFDLHMTTKTVMDKTKRDLLIAASSERKNEATKSFLGRIRNAFEEAMISETETYTYTPDISQEDLANRAVDASDWDQYEQSVLRKVADGIKVSISGKTVDLTVEKSF